MKKAVAMKFSMLTVLLFIATLLPVGTAHAYLYDSGTSASSDYYSQYYGDSNAGETVNTNPDSTTENQSEAVNNESNTGTSGNTYSDYYSNRSDYYSRYYDNSTSNPDPSGDTGNNDTTDPTDETGNSNSGTTAPSQPDSNTGNSDSYSNYYDRSSWYDRYYNNNNSGATTPGNGSDNTPAPSTPGETTDPGDVVSLTADEKLMLDLVNQEREKAGLHTFSVNSELVRLARMKSQDMYENNYFSHTSPTYGTAYDMEKDAGFNARVMGAENIAKAATVSRAHTLFMNSDGHRANIMNSRHDMIGIGIVSTPNGVYVTQLFAGN